MGNIPQFDKFTFTGGDPVDVDWEPTQPCFISAIEVSLDEAAETDEDITAYILDADGDVVFNFEPVTPLSETPQVEFTIVPETSSAVVPAGGKVTVDFLNTDDIDPIKVIISSILSETEWRL